MGSMLAMKGDREVDQQEGKGEEDQKQQGFDFLEVYLYVEFEGRERVELTILVIEKCAARQGKRSRRVFAFCANFLGDLPQLI